MTRVGRVSWARSVTPRFVKRPTQNAQTFKVRRRLTLVALALVGAVVSIVAAGGAAPAAASGPPPCFAQVPTESGTFGWAFSTSAPLTRSAGRYARALGSLNFAANRITGGICQVRYVHASAELVVLHVLSPMILHTHFARVRGFPANEIETHVRVATSSDRGCRVGTVGTLTMLATYDGVRQDSVTLTFPAGCASQVSSYQGPQVKALVPAT